MCRGIHRRLQPVFYRRNPENPVRDNYQYQYAKRLRNKNIWIYHDKHRIAKRNIAILTELLKKALVIRSENQEVLSDRGTIVTFQAVAYRQKREANLFKRILRGDNTDFVVEYTDRCQWFTDEPTGRCGTAGLYDQLCPE